MDEPTIRCTIDLDLSVDELWTMIATAQGWASWLVDDADVDVRPGAAGTVTDDATHKHVRIDRVEAGRSVAFTWWDADETSTVELAVRTLDDGRSQLSIAERHVTTASASASMRWELRLLLLCAAALPVLSRV